jgi:hypothetical protein
VTWRLDVAYRGPLNAQLDQKLSRLVGVAPSGAGQSFNRRDLEFPLPSEEAARAARARLLAEREQLEVFIEAPGA